MPAFPASPARLWTARIFAGVSVAFLLMDSMMKVLKLAPAVKATAELGFPAESVIVLGIVQLVCTILYIIPRTSMLGAILLTGYLGGAIATHVRLNNPLFTHILFPGYIALLLWGGLYLRDVRLQQLIPARATA
ncbi:MAG: DoxX family protein [Gemmatimonas sp.]